MKWPEISAGLIVNKACIFTLIVYILYHLFLEGASGLHACSTAHRLHSYWRVWRTFLILHRGIYYSSKIYFFCFTQLVLFLMNARLLFCLAVVAVMFKYFPSKFNFPSSSVTHGIQRGVCMRIFMCLTDETPIQEILSLSLKQ